MSAKQKETKKPRGPLREDTAFGEEGRAGQLTRKKDIASEEKLIKQGVAMNNDVAAALRNKDYSGAAKIQALMKTMGFGAGIGALGPIPNVKAIRAMAVTNYNTKSPKRAKLGREQKAADKLENEVREGKAKETPKDKPAVGKGKDTDDLSEDEDANPSKAEPTVGEDEDANPPEWVDKSGGYPDAEDADGLPDDTAVSGEGVGEADASDVVEKQVRLGYDPNPPERKAQKDVREAQERVTAERGFGDQKKKKAFGERFGHGARDTKQKFLDDLDNSDLIKDSRGLGKGDPFSAEVNKAKDRAYKRAKDLDIDREDLQKKMGWETDSEVSTAKEAEVSEESTRRFEAEQEARIKEMKAAPGYEPLFSDELLNTLDPERIQAFQDEVAASVEKARTNTEIAESRSYLQMEEVREKVTENQLAFKARTDAGKVIDKRLSEMKNAPSGSSQPQELYSGKLKESILASLESEDTTNMSEEDVEGFINSRLNNAQAIEDSFQSLLGGEYVQASRKSVGSTELDDFGNPIISRKQFKTDSFQKEGLSKIKKIALAKVDGPSDSTPSGSFLKTIGLGGTAAEDLFTSLSSSDPRKIDNSAFRKNFKRNAMIIPAQDRIINAALDTGRSLEGEKDLMANPDFVKRYNKALAASREARIYNVDSTYNANSEPEKF